MEMNVNNIKNKKESINMKKPFILLMLVLVSLFSANAVTMSFNQNENLYTFENSIKGNNMYGIYSSTVNNLYAITGNQTINSNYTYDYQLEFTEVNQEFYLAIENYFINTTYQVYFHGDLTKDGTLYIQELNLKEQGTYFLKFYPSGIEPVRIYIDADDSAGAIFDVTYIEEKPKGFNDLIGGLVDTFTAVFNINLKLWYLLYYVIIFVLVIGFMSMLFGIASFLFKKSEEIKNKKTIHHHKEDRED